jgi:hypothetical protein
MVDLGWLSNLPELRELGRRQHGSGQSLPTTLHIKITCKGFFGFFLVFVLVLGVVMEFELKLHIS